MNQKKVKAKYQAWLSTETMHNDSLKWLSELRFAKDEQLFFDDLVKSYTLQLIDSKHYTESKKTISQLSALHKETNALIDKIIEHDNGLKIMVDGVNQIEEENAYKNEHAKLIIIASKFSEKYRTLKTQLFSLIKSVLKEGKQKRLLQ
tara:strand:- start:6112 stop:6555 length:444 start_codon:yes stop_codon:yes gene_type:complete